MKKLILLSIVSSITFIISGCTKEKDLQVEKLELLNPKIELKVSQSHKLVVNHSPSSLPAHEYRFSSNNVNAVTVSADGLLKGIAPGKAVITVTSVEKSELRASCEVLVSNIDPTSFLLNKTATEITIGSSEKISYTILPDNSTLKEIIWTSSNNNIAGVDTQGNITAKTIGEATIKAEIAGTQLHSICTVSVIPIPATGISFEEERITALLGKEYIIEATITPSNATNKEITYESTDDSILEVTFQEGRCRVIAKGIGHAGVTAKTADKKHLATCHFAVTEINDFVSVELKAGTQGNSNTGFYSYVFAVFKTNTEEEVEIKKIHIIDNENEHKFTDTNIDGKHSSYRTEKIRTTDGIQTYRAIEWRVEVFYRWNNKDYYISKMKEE